MSRRNHRLRNANIHPSRMVILRHRVEEAAMEDFSKNLLIAALPGGSYWLLGLLLL
ncbi:hypothetical protein [Magnetospirillum sp. XM-1]|uniref:hypothetical protein n=1 Tax=Magnetospirillum sp. XM-1 TaxID=1663591 RepID=UPI0012E361FE|nr:hypothetical protein [Magnetospirillum sp. XM-1]